jgi:two-component system sensor histidine kinase AlgZ
LARHFAGSTNSIGLHVDFLISNLGISAIVSAILLRFFYVQFQRDRSLQARSEARIQALHARIRPHFLFNSLNTIASLTRSQPDVAEEATEDLADLFRSSLANANYEVRLKEEWELARRYLHIEELRLGPRLQVNWAIDTLPEDALIPQLTIQPLLENAIYHGLEHLPQGGMIMIEGAIEAGKEQNAQGSKNESCITIYITNPMPEFSRENQRVGNKMAQENVRLRLAALYEDKGTLTVERKGNEYCTRIRFPYLKESLKEQA